MFIAKERGYFAGEGLDVEIKTFDAAQPVALAVAANDADFGVTAFTGAFFNLAGKGALKVIAAQSREEPGYDFVAYVAAKAAYEAGLRSPKDLAGILAGFRISTSIALILVVAAEMIGSQLGIGAFVLAAGNLMQTDQLLAGVLMLSLLGLCISWLISRVEALLLRWR